jgi:ATP-dependent DNA helicase DinG
LTLHQAIDEVLGADGLLARTLDGFSFRSQQLDMAHAVGEVFEAGSVLVAEAGTGTGKTFAYLVPAMLSGRKVIVSTGTRALQDQLYLRDLPRVRESLASPVRTALLKGRANYLCRHRLGSALADVRGHRREVARALKRVRDWSTVTRRGDIAELAGVPEESPVWPLVTATADNCLGQECPSYSACHLVEARRQAQEADLVVINHHLLCADFSLKGDGFGELLPACDAFVIDEAHQLPEVASNFFGTSLTTRQILELVRDTRVEYTREAGDTPELVERLDVLEKVARDLRLAFGTEPRRGAWKELESDPAVAPALEAVTAALDALGEMLEPLQGRGKGLEQCLVRARGQQAALASLRDPQKAEREVRWFETYVQSLRLSSTPLDIAAIFAEQMGRHPAAWVFTSATLAVGDDFSHFTAQLGLTGQRERRWDSPFDFANQALWFAPRGLPAPSDPGYLPAVMEIALPILEASRGRAFFLFTSHRALTRAAQWLSGRTELPVLVQGESSKAEMLLRFVRLGNAVLLGTASFWEGVDVRGQALSVVLVDKLPFASPGDPVLQARLDALQRRGRNAFMSYQVPQAAIALKQGAGRLIRDISDRGLLVTFDPRMLRRGYGQKFLDAMPPFARTRDLEAALAFCAALPGGEDRGHAVAGPLAGAQEH